MVCDLICIKEFTHTCYEVGTITIPVGTEAIFIKEVLPNIITVMIPFFDGLRVLTLEKNFMRKDFKPNFRKHRLTKVFMGS